MKTFSDTLRQLIPDWFEDNDVDEVFNRHEPLKVTVTLGLRSGSVVVKEELPLVAFSSPSNGDRGRMMMEALNRLATMAREQRRLADVYYDPATIVRPTIPVDPARQDRFKMIAEEMKEVTR